MKMRTQIVSGQDQLLIEPTTDVEVTLLKEFAGPRTHLSITLHTDRGYKNPLIIIQKET